jgi:NADH-quinone oxidoreductase subunit F
VDIHFNAATATPEERSAVDSVLGPATTRWEGGARSGDEDSRVSFGGHDARSQRHLLLPVLNGVQSRMGWVSAGALNYVSERLTIPPAEAYGVASFYALLATEEQPPVVAHVCDDIACKVSGADELIAALESSCGPEGTPDGSGRAAWKRSPCLGLCEKAPAVLVQVAGEGSEDFTIAPAGEAEVRAGMDTARPVGIRAPGASTPQPWESSLRLLRRVGRVDPASLDDYRSEGGYEALRNALDLGPDGVAREVTDAKLVGRGGAAFPTGVKWRSVAQAAQHPHYVVCNADESEPGTFKDRVIMEEDPFAVVEALTIAGFATGSEQGFIYVRGEYPEARRALEGAIETARTRGFLGRSVLGHEGFDFDVELRVGAGAYICGEETALFNSIEGGRGEPRNKPPFPVTHGLFGKPTSINNVETLVNTLEILRVGGLAYAETGTPNSTGHKLFCVSGCVEKAGLYEAPFGITLSELLDLAGGVREGREIQAVLLGGAAGAFITSEHLDVPLTLDGTREIGATLGSGVVMVFDDRVDLEAIVLRIAAFFRDESCGQCVPCRVGTVRQEEALHRLHAGSGHGDADIALLAELEQVMKDASICGLGQTAANAVQSAVHKLGLFGGGAS